jgi:hypothetical protein
MLDSRSALSDVKTTDELINRKRSILDVALQTYNSQHNKEDAARMDTKFRQMTIDQIRTFIFAVSLKTKLNMYVYL